MKRISQAELEDSRRFADELPRLTRITPTGPANNASVTITMRRAAMRIHSALGLVPMWGYEGMVPGPCIETTVDQRVRTTFRNRITGALPFSSVRGEDDAQRVAGRDAAVDVDARAEGLAAWTVVHQHGGRTEADSDGWTENVFGTGDDRVAHYRNTRAATLWFHDHAMGVTRLNVYAGLAGMWIVRDAVDAHLPAQDRELILVMQDRNLETDVNGHLTARLLHKTGNRSGGPMEFFGPFTLVNGAVWPKCRVERAQHRVRIVNGSNARTFRLTLVDAAGVRHMSRVHQIGTDGGLLPVDPQATPQARAGMGPFRFTDDQDLVIAPGERVDLIVDFRGATGPLRFVNEAVAPYANDVAPVDLVTGRATDPAALRANVADVMRFDPQPATAPDTFDLNALVASNRWPTYRRYDHNTPPFDQHMHRLVALVENPDTGVLTLHELWEPGDEHTVAHLGDRADYLLRAPYLSLLSMGKVTTYATAAAAFDDAVTFQPEQDAYELWKIVNLTGDTHPFHIHLVQFQVLARTSLSWATTGAYPGGEWAPAANIDPTGAGNQVVTLGGVPGALERADTGWNDTIRVNPGEMLSLMAQFDGHSGRYMYHCHILEHEDHDMMRPFVVVPTGIAAAHGH